MAIDLAYGDAIKENRGFAGGQEVSDPSTPFFREPAAMKNVDKAVPMDRVKSLVKVKLQDNGGGVTTKTAMEQVSGISETFNNTSAKNKARLVTANKGRNQGLQPISENLGNSFDGRVLEDDRPEILSPPSIIFLWKQNKVGPVNAFKISSVAVEGFGQGKDFRGSERSGRLEEIGTEPVRARTSIGVHAVESMINLRAIKPRIQMIKGHGSLSVEAVEMESPPDVSSTSPEIVVKRL
jgi:hypothetical protein